MAEEFLKKRKDGSYQKALNLFQLVKLGNIPKPGMKDRRFFERNEARNNALICRNGFLKMKDEEDKEIYLETIIRLAKASGFFSVWMTVFEDIKSVRTRLINDFAGTRKKYFENTDSFSKK